MTDDYHGNADINHRGGTPGCAARQQQHPLLHLSFSHPAHCTEHAAAAQSGLCLVLPLRVLWQCHQVQEECFSPRCTGHGCACVYWELVRTSGNFSYWVCDLNAPGLGGRWWVLLQEFLYNKVLRRG